VPQSVLALVVVVLLLLVLVLLILLVLLMLLVLLVLMVLLVLLVLLVIVVAVEVVVVVSVAVVPVVLVVATVSVSATIMSKGFATEMALTIIPVLFWKDPCIAVAKPDGLWLSSCSNMLPTDAFVTNSPYRTSVEAVTRRGATPEASVVGAAGADARRRAAMPPHAERVSETKSEASWCIPVTVVHQSAIPAFRAE